MSEEPATAKAAPGTPALMMPQRKLADKLSADWAWLSTAYTQTFSGSEKAFSENVTKTRTLVQSTVDSAFDMRANAELSVSKLTEPSTATTAMKQKFLDFRRDYVQFMVAAIAVVSVAPAIRAGPGRLEKLRVGMRNLIFGAGSAAVLIYPEAMSQAAPALGQAADRVTQQVVLKARKSRSPEGGA